MSRGRYATLKAVTCERGFLTPEFEVAPEDPTEYVFDPPSNVSMGRSPGLPDPYETETVEVRDSLLPGAGKGTTAFRDRIREQLIGLEETWIARCAN